ncbi:exonuclease domain-containing protein [Thalassotalea marina]|uniref:3'-5' exonuclease n=1 Tax=Thalassotalea marina TaxID=1673741 RepID=A0A919BHD5_9GAMM|nr:exonuclease domain-containing protein [Thalassotalea marina]GHF89289.1 3'-5' exonuclease [Thalassotalea marina]
MMWQNQLPFRWWLGFEAKRKRALALAPEGPLKDFLATPFPDLSCPVNELPLVAVDFETTGLDAVADKLLSVGFCQLESGLINLGSSFHQIINTKQKLKPENVVVHHITDEQQQQGLPLEEVVEDLLKALAGKVMLVHFNQIERHFLQQACLELYGVKPPLLMIDTLLIAKRRLDQRDVAYDPSELRLTNQRSYYQLPHYAAHNALSDAVATAELFLAQTTHLSKDTTLSSLLA